MDHVKYEVCPCPGAHRRLMDLHEDIHRAVEAYLDENEFRRWLNSAIQNSRAVTFLLQKQKAKWPDFEAWYEPWQERARANPVLSWGVVARNRIVKEEDLRTLSQAVVSRYGKRLKEAEDVWLVPPNLPAEAIVAEFVKLADEKPAGRPGWVRVQRRWIDDELPEYELVAALKEMYRGVAEIMHIAHIVSGIGAEQCQVPKFTHDCVSAGVEPGLSCFGPEPIPSMLVNIETGGVARIERISMKTSEELAAAGRKKYGKPLRLSVDPIEHAIQRLELSKKFLQTDGYSGPALALFGQGAVRYHAVIFGDDEPREFKIAAAIESEGAWQFDGAVYSSETWLGLPGSRGSHLPVPKDRLLPSTDGLFNASRSRDRDEALIVIGLAADGRSRALILPFGRVLGGYVFGELMDDEFGEAIPSFLSPIWHHWR